MKLAHYSTHRRQACEDMTEVSPLRLEQKSPSLLGSLLSVLAEIEQKGKIMTDLGKMLGLAEPLQRVVAQKFTVASEAKDVIFSTTSLAHLRAKGGASVSA